VSEEAMNTSEQMRRSTDMTAAPGETIPSETRLFLHLAAGHLQELALALKQIGVPSRYERPGVEGVVLPRLVVEHAEHGELDEVICASAWRLPGPDAHWWFEWWEWWQGARVPICRIRDIDEAAQVIARQLGYKIVRPPTRTYSSATNRQ
jgi:hypothetical protein